MKLLVVVDGHLVRTPDGKIWSSRIYNYDFFARYLSVFENVRIAIRIKDVDTNDQYPNLCSGENIEFYQIDDFRGPKQYLKKFFSIKKQIKESHNGCDCAIFRVPSSLGFQFLKCFSKTKKPYALEVVVDPWDYAAPGMMKSIFRPIVRLLWTLSLKKYCLKANGVSYVTKEALQKRYPSYSILHNNSNKFDSYYSSISISKDMFGKPKTFNFKNQNCNIIHIANNIGNYVKGHKELIEATSILKEKGVKVNVTFVGEGDLIDEFKKLAEKRNVLNQITFIGKLSNSKEVMEKLKKADMFVFPSHAEGLPRVLIEAMAAGLPCVSTCVNGIPELIEGEYLVSPGEVKQLANIIDKLIKNEKKMEEISKRNISKAYEYTEDNLKKRRDSFYEKLKKETLNQKWSD